jgi:hypothetical protein
LKALGVTARHHIRRRLEGLGVTARHHIRRRLEALGLAITWCVNAASPRRQVLPLRCSPDLPAP